jgi:hypothetical protein
MQRTPLLLLCAAALAGATVADAQQWTATTGFDYSTGKYGESSSTDIFYVPLIGRYEMDAWTFKATIPYLHIDGPGNVTPDLGRVGGPAASRARQTESGLGDVITSAEYDFYHDAASGFLLGATGKVKWGTASRSKGLGTGENDYSLQLDAFQPLGDLTPFASAGYRIYGSPPGITLRDGWFGSLGASYKLDLDNSVGASVDLREKIFDGGDPAEELTGFFSHKFDPNWKTQVYALTGFTHASPDFGFGGLLSYRF